MLSVRKLIPFFVVVLSISAVCQMSPAQDSFSPRNMQVDADPFQLPTGIYYRNYTDFEIKDDIPIDLVRTQRNRDPESRTFGRGASSSYDIYVAGDALKFSWLALYFPDDSWATFKRINPGIHFYDGIFENTEPGEFLHARIA